MLTTMPQFSQPDKIQSLLLNHNPLRHLDKEIFLSLNMINLQKVILKDIMFSLAGKCLQSHCVQVYLSNCSIRVVDGTAFSNLALMIELDLSNNKDRCTLELLINLHYKTTLSMLYSNIILKWMQKLTFLSDAIKNQNAEQTKLQLPSQQ